MTSDKCSTKIKIWLGIKVQISPVGNHKKMQTLQKIYMQKDTADSEYVMIKCVPFNIS